MNKAKTYKARRTVHRKPSGATTQMMQLTVPAHIARQIPEGIEFVAELTEEGILYRAVRVEELATPAWLRGSNGNGNGNGRG